MAKERWGNLLFNELTQTVQMYDGKTRRHHRQTTIFRRSLLFSPTIEVNFQDFRPNREDLLQKSALAACDVGSPFVGSGERTTSEPKW